MLSSGSRGAVGPNGKLSTVARGACSHSRRVARHLSLATCCQRFARRPHSRIDRGSRRRAGWIFAGRNGRRSRTRRLRVPGPRPRRPGYRANRRVRRHSRCLRGRLRRVLWRVGNTGDRRTCRPPKRRCSTASHPTRLCRGRCLAVPVQTHCDCRRDDRCRSCAWRRSAVRRAVSGHKGHVDYATSCGSEWAGADRRPRP